jgi:hypothetical protein
VAIETKDREAVVVELRETLMLPLDDLPVVTRNKGSNPASNL